MSTAPVYEIDTAKFWNDPYPDLKRMRADRPIAYVPQLGATLITRRNDIFENEKKTDIFSSEQPDGLMTVLMGQNMMRKDGDAHMFERKAIFPSVSPRTARDVWTDPFRDITARKLDELAPVGACDLVSDFAMPIAANALKCLTGLTNMDAAEMNRVSQGMIDGCANYAGDAKVEANCRDCTASIDRHIDSMINVLDATPNPSLLSVQRQAGLPMEQVRANVKLAISGGQNEARDAIAGTAWALLTHRDQLERVLAGEATWLQAFEEFARWMSLIGMSPRQVAERYQLHDVTFEKRDRVFLMFGSGNRDETVFSNPDNFDISQDSSAAISFGAGPHFCAGAWASKALIADVALPMLFDRLKGLTVTSAPRFGGWAFRGPLSVPVEWHPSG